MNNKPGSHFLKDLDIDSAPYTRHRLALVTGASRGIGAAIAETLACDGFDLIITADRSTSPLHAIAHKLTQSYSISCRAEVCDMANPAEVALLFSSIQHLDLLVNNAGIAWAGLLQDMTDEMWARIINVNLSSVFYTCRAAIPIFLGQLQPDRTSSRESSEKTGICPGRIINISSVWGNVGASCEVAYSATKGGVNAFTRALGKELAPSGIPVNAIACGCVDTIMNNNLTTNEKEVLSQEIPAGRFARPDEIAVILRQLTSAPPYLTGQVITVDGGWT